MNELVSIFEESRTTLSPSNPANSDREAYLQRQKASAEPPPSQKAVMDLYAHKPYALEKVVETFLGRAVIIGTAITVFGDKRSVVKNSLVASASIEAFLLWWHKLRAKQ